jgi:hypothetical protein
MAVKRPTSCSVDYCFSNSRIVKGMCLKHYDRMRINGTLKVSYFEGVGPTLEHQFWSRVAVTANPDKCWNWLAAIFKSTGYGSACLPGSDSTTAHRIAWLYTYGKWPAMNLLHSCDNRLCVNPNHLREGTQKENYKDAKNRGRIPRIVLTDANVRSIRIDSRHPQVIGDAYGISASHARKVRDRTQRLDVSEVAHEPTV